MEHQCTYNNKSIWAQLHFSYSQLPIHHRRYSRARAQYNDYMYKFQLLTQRLFKQCYVAPILKKSLQKYTIVITNWMAVTKYSFLKWQWEILRRFFSFCYNQLDFYQTWLTVTWRMSYRQHALLTIYKRMRSLFLWWDACFLIFFVFCAVCFVMFAFYLCLEPIIACIT